MNIVVYIVDDYEPILSNIAELFKHEGINNFKTFSDPDEFLKSIVPEVHVCIIDFRFKDYGYNGIELMRQVKEINPGCLCIVMSAHIDIGQYMRINNENPYKFLDKLHPEFDSDLVRYTKMAIAQAKATYERMGKMYQKYNREGGY